MIALCGVGIALMFVVTAFIQFPMPIAGGGYVHLGDAVLFVISAIFGPIVGTVVGGAGGFFADLYLGYPMYMGFTLVIKAVQGLVVGVMFKRLRQNIFGYIGAMLFAGLWMIAAYFLVDNILFNIEVALSASLGNLFQIIAGVVFAIIAYPTVARMRLADAMEEYNEAILSGEYDVEKEDNKSDVDADKHETVIK